nr:MAG TPA_asm: hypothetical protein [Caudoviricetes sp.]
MVLFLYAFLTFYGRLFLCPKRADDIIKASKEYSVDRLYTEVYLMENNQSNIIEETKHNENLETTHE